MTSVFGRSKPVDALLPVLLIALILTAKAWVLLYDHSLHSIDGVLQTWFALENFAHGKQLGTDFQSYLGVTMILALLPTYIVFGGTLYASTLSAHLAVLVGVFASAYVVAWLIRPIPARHRWLWAIVLVFLFYYALPLVAGALGVPYPVSLDPGVSLRSVRGFLPVFVLPFFVSALRRLLTSESPKPAFALGLIAGLGLLWSNDAGIPMVIAMVLALTMALHHNPAVLAKAMLALSAGAAIAATMLLMLVSHAEPGAWLQYNFRDVAGDQGWYFAPWDRDTRIFGLADFRHILTSGVSLSIGSLIVLASTVLFALFKRMRSRGSPIRSAGFIFVGASTVGTALIPQLGGHIDTAYNDITFFLGCCALLIAVQRPLFRLVKPALRRINPKAPVMLAGAAVSLILVSEASHIAQTANAHERSTYAEELGFYVTPEFAADLEAMRRLSAHWDARSIPSDHRLLSVYTSALDLAARSDSPTPVGSLIHALGPTNRAEFVGLVANASIEAVTTIAPDYSGWEGWILRANWPFFEALRKNYRPLARNDQHLLWVRTRVPTEPLGPAECRVTQLTPSMLRLEITANLAGLASVSVNRSGTFGSGRTAQLVATETSPFTKAAAGTWPWIDFPSYGVANTNSVSLVAPLDAGKITTIQLELIDGSEIGNASCSARMFEPIDTASLPSLPAGIDRYLAEGAL